jgi:PAS domain-containing protein
MRPVRDQDSKVLVVDTDVVLHASARREPLPRPSRECRHLLMEILEVCHRAILTPALKEEYHRRRSPFLRRWRRWMHGPKKLVMRHVLANQNLRRRVLRSVPPRCDPEEVLKDMPLIEAALAADGTIVSCDRPARDAFGGAAREVRELREIVWVNPADVGEEALTAWLEEGAPPRDEWTLGYSPDD